MKIVDEWKKYIATWKKVSYDKFTRYVREYWTIEEAIKNLEIYRGNWRIGYTKVKNPREVASYARINSVARAAEVYGVSERQVYRYMERYIR